ncbi:MAG TPA: hypothetical protein VN018_04600 [Brevundimonas sp.]|nr:hypothetical protein [Brevundimonas sp.]
MKSVLIYAIFRTEAWWSHVGSQMGFERVTVLTDKRGRGDQWVTDDFYAAHRTFKASRAEDSNLLSSDEVRDIIARCRVLRWYPKAKATAMILAMAQAMDQALERVSPDVIVSLPIDNYVKDTLERRARARGIPYFELTVSALPGMSMLLYRGRLITSDQAPDPEQVRARVAEIADPEFAPAYVQGARTYTGRKFYQVLGRFRIRGAFFKLYSWLKRDPLGIHFLDAQPDLGHKARLADARIVNLVDHDWMKRIEAFPKARRVLYGLQVFPEAAVDYWLDDLSLLQQETLLVELAQKLSDAGYQILVKDHPLQFGFRQTALLETLRAIPNVVLVPYEVSGNAMLALCGVGVTATGTLGLQAALLGNVSIACQAYYVVDDDFLVIREWSDIARIPEQLAHRQPPEPLEARQSRIVSHLLRGSFDGQFMSLFGFDPAAPGDATHMGRELGKRLRQMGPDGEDWHRRNLTDTGGAHSGSPLNAPQRPASADRV